MHVQTVLAFPGSTARTTNDLRVSVTLANTTGALASRGQTTKFMMFVNVLADPVDLGVTTDGIVVGINQNDFEVFVGSILGNPVGVQYT